LHERVLSTLNRGISDYHKDTLLSFPVHPQLLIIALLSQESGQVLAEVPGEDLGEVLSEESGQVPGKVLGKVLSQEPGQALAEELGKAFREALSEAPG
jgi:hypothetical protein